MNKLITLSAAALVAVMANQAMAQCASCAAAGNAPVFGQSQSYGAPSYAAPMQYSAPVQQYSGYSQPTYDAGMSYAQPSQSQTSYPSYEGTMVSSGGYGSGCANCSSCAGCSGGVAFNGGYAPQGYPTVINGEAVVPGSFRIVSGPSSEQSGNVTSPAADNSTPPVPTPIQGGEGNGATPQPESDSVITPDAPVKPSDDAGDDT